MITTDLSLHTLWGLLTEEEHLDACRCFWTGDSFMAKKMRPEVIYHLARIRNFREKFVHDRPLEWKVRELTGRIQVRPLLGFMDDVIREFVIERKLDMVCAILDGEGTPHNRGWIAENAPAPTVEIFVKGLCSVSGKFKTRDLLLYYGLNKVTCPNEHWEALEEAFQTKEFRKLVENVLSDSPQIVANTTVEVVAKDAGEPESNDDFTTLDNVLIKTVVACAIGADGALTEDALEDLVQEVIALNADRQRSYFHQGYLDAVLNRALRWEFPGANVTRRSWCLAGYVMGRMRSSAGVEIAAWIKENRKRWDELMDQGPMAARVMLLPSVMDRLREAAEWPLMTNLLEKSNLPKDSNKAVDVCVTVFESASGLVRLGNATEAIPLLSHLLGHVTDCPWLPEKFAAGFVPATTRKLGQAFLRTGNFNSAKEYLKEAIAASDDGDAANARTDLGLAEAGARSLEFVLPKEDEKVTESVICGLEAQTTHFNEAVSGSGHSTNADFVLGLISFHRDRTEEAERHLNNALAGMLQKEDAYQVGYLLDWVRFLLAVVITEQCEQARLNEVKQLIDAAVASPAVFPLRLWSRLVSTAALYEDTSLAETVIVHLLSKRGDPAFELLRASGLILRNNAIRVRYRQWLDSRQMAPSERARELESLLAASLSAGDLNVATEILDQLEGVAKTDSSYAANFIQLLKERRSILLTLWHEDELLYAEAGLLERIGRIDECSVILQQLFFLHRADGQAHDAEAVLEQIQSLGTTVVDIVALRASIALPDEVVAGGSMGLSLDGVRVLYVGGNETQQRYENELRKQISTQHPQMTVGFYYPGWDSGWSVHLARVDALKRNYDVIVINRFVRTQFGRSLRESCNEGAPWRPCTGRGRDSLLRSILNAATWISTIRKK